MTGWQEIGTAPLHDTRVMLWIVRRLPTNPPLETSYAGFGSYQQGDTPRAGWRTDGGVKVAPTHWQPCPEGPTS